MELATVMRMLERAKKKELFIQYMREERYGDAARLIVEAENVEDPI